MKINKITMVFFLITVLFISSISEINSLISKSEKPKKKKGKAKKKKEKVKIPEENTFGKMVKAHTVLKSPPWNVERCDQIVEAKRKMIPDHEDFTKRREVLITITAYYINLFSVENPDKLLHSILFTDSKRFPMLQRGARGCVRVHGGHVHSIIICGNNEKEGKYLHKAIMKFYDCRAGFKKPPKKTKEKFKNVMRACGLNSGFKDPKAIKRRIKQLKKKAKKGANHLRRSTGFFHPGFSGVPGTDK